MENKWNLFEKFLITENQTLSIEDFATNSVLIIILCWILGLTYQKVARSLSNKKDFANNFMILAFTTMLIISIVKSSLALSLGLVGALSIVRFRAAIKEPEELAFLFFSISIGLGLGANQIAIVLVAFLIFMAILWGRFFYQKKDQSQNLFITVNSSKDKIEIGELNSIMSNHFKKHQLRRFDEQEDVTELAFIADVKGSTELESFRKDIVSKYPNSNISFLDSKAY